MKTLTKNDFKQLLLQALDRAALLADTSMEEPVPRTFVIELHSPGHAGSRLSVDEAVDSLYLGKGAFFRIIDVAIREVDSKSSTAFLRVSGHAPVDYERTWNPAEFGPFKLIEPMKVEEDRH